MKIPWFAPTFLLCVPFAILGQVARQDPPTPNASRSYSIVERGPHHRIIATMTWTTNRSGRVFARTNSYTELATGMHHLVDGKWQESSDEIAIVPGGATATNASHRVFLSADAAASDAVRLTMPNGQTLSSHVVGVSYLDTASGSNAMIAELHGSVGQVLPSGKVLYTNAIQGDFIGDILCRFSKAGMEESIIIRTKPIASPADYGLNSSTTMLQVWTEFVNPPVRHSPSCSRANRIRRRRSGFDGCRNQFRRYGYWAREGILNWRGE